MLCPLLPLTTGPAHSISREVRVTENEFRAEDSTNKQIIRAPLDCTSSWSFPSSPPRKGMEKARLQPFPGSTLGSSDRDRVAWGQHRVVTSVTHGHRGCIHLRETLPSTHPSTTLPSTRVSKSTYIFQEEDIESQALQTGLKDSATKAQVHFPAKIHLTPESYQLQERDIEKLPRQN